MTWPAANLKEGTHFSWAARELPRTRKRDRNFVRVESLATVLSSADGSAKRSKRPTVGGDLGKWGVIEKFFQAYPSY
jgi:hypothetical protein